MTLISPGDYCTLQCGMWLWNRDSEFTKWQHPANVIRGSGMTCHWICPVVAPCSVTCSSGIMTFNSPGGSTLQCVISGMTCHWIRPNIRHIVFLHLVSILTISPQSTCHCAPVSEILWKLDHPRQKKMTSCRFSRWRISAILDFRDQIIGCLKSPIT